MKTTCLLVTLLLGYAAAGIIKYQDDAVGNDNCCSCMTTFKNNKCEIKAKPGRMVEVMCEPDAASCVGEYVIQEYRVGIYWGDAAYTSRTYTRAEKFTLSHTYAEAGCSDILITYGNLYPYCGEYYRQIVTVLN